MRSPEYHKAHLAFARLEIMEAHAERRPILDLLHRYTEDVTAAERDRIYRDLDHYDRVRDEQAERSEDESE